MAVAITYTSCLRGIEANVIAVEADLNKGLPRFDIVGLPDNTIKESKIRVISAIKNTSGSFPLNKITINLSPANIQKHGSTFDLPIAIAILTATTILPAGYFKDYLILGELSLEGNIIKATGGVLAAAQAAKEAGLKGLICPFDNAEEASLIDDIDIVVAKSLSEIVKLVQEEQPFKKIEKKILSPKNDDGLDLVDVMGNEKGKLALMIAAAGGHNLLFIGPPGSGKTMLAKRLNGILPPLTNEQAIEVAKIYSAAGNLDKQVLDNFGKRPFREPHHTISNVGLVGGGVTPKPGEISLAHNGALFLDEFAEFPASLLDLLRQPLENHYITVVRAKSSLKFPCNFQLIAAMNPCPCGYAYSERCKCSAQMIQKYRAKISGPILDRIDLQVEIPNLSFEKISNSKTGLSSAAARDKVIVALNMQKTRFKNNATNNASIGHRDLKIYCQLDNDSRSFMKQAMEKWQFSNRTHDRLLKVTRTIADLEASENITLNHLATALNYRLGEKN